MFPGNFGMLTMWAERHWRCSFQENENGKTKNELFRCGEYGCEE